MRKRTVCILMTGLMLLTTGLSVGLGRLHAQHVLAQQSNPPPSQWENPAPVDRAELAELGLEPFVSNLPVLMLDTRNQTISDMEEVLVGAAVYEREENDILAQPDRVLNARIRLRGADPQGREKKQYRLEFVKNDPKKERRYDLFGMGKASSWVLHGPYVDKSLVRNALMYTLAASCMDWAPEFRFCELFTDGHYQGVYLAVEPVTVESGRVELSRFGLVSGATPYLLRREAPGHEDDPIQTWAGTRGLTANELTISWPGRRRITSRQREWICRDIGAFEAALYGENFADPAMGWARYIDPESFADYLILNELAMNREGGLTSTYVYRDLEGPLRMCVWDFNRAFNNFREPLAVDQSVMEGNPWFDRLLEDPAFRALTAQRYRELRQGILSPEQLRGTLEGLLDTLGPAAERNFARWGHTFERYMLHDAEGKHRNPADHREAVEQLEETMLARLAWMDETLPTWEN